MPTQRRGRVEFEHVSFRYKPDEPLIDDLSLVAEPGHTIAIVGPTGAGKTTLVNLIMRFYELDSGRITLDGVDITAMRRDQLRGEIGMVLQDTWLFGGTIWDNLAYGRPGRERRARSWPPAGPRSSISFVQALPDGYQTVLDEETSNVSAGQKQLITIARAFLADPALLILDEATSSVDTRTELLVQHATAALRANRTSFVVAHRLSTIRDADLILVMDGGRIVEQGNHDELLARRGAYYELYSTQFTAADERGRSGPGGVTRLDGAGTLPNVDYELHYASHEEFAADRRSSTARASVSTTRTRNRAMPSSTSSSTRCSWRATATGSSARAARCRSR